MSRAIVLGVPKPVLKSIARDTGVNHRLALDLWDTGVHEARILATLIADPSFMDDSVLDKWLSSIDNWDLCDQLVLNLLWRIDDAFKKAVELCIREHEFTKRAGYGLLARLVWKRVIGYSELYGIRDLIIHGVLDQRPYVYKAVSWLLKWMARREDTRELAIELVREIGELNTPSARFIVRDVKKYLK